MKKISLVLIVSLLFSFNTYADYRQYERTGYLMIAHMGDWYNLGPNTLEAYQSAADKGFYGVEGDLRYDWVENILYMSHDPQATPSNFPTFEQFIAICKEGNIRPVVDIKWGMKDKGLDKALQIVKDYDMEDLVIWQDNYEHNIKYIRNKATNSDIWYLVGYNKEKQRDKAIRIATENNCSAINSSKTVLDKEWIDEMHTAGLLTCVYSENNKTERDFWLCQGIDILMTDRE